MKNRAKTKLLVYMLLAMSASVLSILGLTYAYFILPIIDNNVSSTKFVTGTLFTSLTDTELLVENAAPIYSDTIYDYAYSKEFTLINNGSLDGCVSLYIDITSISEELKSEHFKWKLINITEEKEYDGTFDSAVEGTKLLLTEEEDSPVNSETDYKLLIWIEYSDLTDQVSMLGKSLSGKVVTSTLDCKIEISGLYSTLLDNNEVLMSSLSFGSVSNSSNTGLYSAEDDYGTSYYFRGNKNELNNNVIFGGYQWKIIRMTGLGNIKLIYNGLCPNNSCTINSTGTGTLVGTIRYNAQYMVAKYAGYMFDTNTDSEIKKVVDNWYVNSTISSASKNKIVDTIYCNDRSITGTQSTFTAYFGPYGRLYTNKTPTLKCPQQVDAFTVDDEENGNGLLTYPVGLITADEIAMAGGVTLAQNTTFYLYSNQIYLSMSPYMLLGSLYIYNVDAGGMMNRGLATIAAGVRPVITLKSTVETSEGDGSALSPYIIVE